MKFRDENKKKIIGKCQILYRLFLRNARKPEVLCYFLFLAEILN